MVFLPKRNTVIVVGFLIALTLVSRTASAPPADAKPDPAVAQSVAENPSFPNRTASTNQSSVAAATIDLMDKNKFTFLDECEDEELLTADEKLCELYKDLVNSLIKRQPENLSVLANKIISTGSTAPIDKMDLAGFCKNLTVMIELQKLDKPSLTAEICELACFFKNGKTIHSKPICRVLPVLLQAAKANVPSKEEHIESHQQSSDKQTGGETVAPEKVPLKDVLSEQAELGKRVEEESVLTVPSGPSQKAIRGKPEQEHVPNAPVGSNATNTKPDVPAPKNENLSEQASVTEPSGVAVAKPPPANLKPIVSAPDQTENDNKEDAHQSNADQAANNQSEKVALDDDYTGDSNEEREDDDVEQPKGDELMDRNPPLPQEEQQQEQQPPPQQIPLHEKQVSNVLNDPFVNETGSNFFPYFLFAMFTCIACYVAYHNKSKILALALEGRRSSAGRGGFSKGRKHTAAYRKLDCNLEEAITSNTAAASSRSSAQIIY